ncbi:Fic family protein [Chitinophaga sp. 22536]|uniref:Fic family protein n=1 Tax=unclassified Chitinophaga TaxID=2619133 RepID=UPI003F85FC2D
MQTDNKVTQQIISVLKKFREGAAIEDIFKTGEIDVSLSTLKRRLADLISQGIVEATGNTRSRRFRLIESDEFEDFLLKPGSRALLKKLRVPYQQRNVVGYNRAFLENYQPNEDSFLTAEERNQLSDWGQTGQDGQPAGTYARNILNQLLIDLSWNSSRLEGNTYSLLDTKRLINQGIEAADKSTIDAQMIINHKEAINFLVYNPEGIGFNAYTIRNLHALLVANLLSDPAAEGRLRTIPVNIAQSAFIPASAPQLIEEMFLMMLTKASAIRNPFEQAIFVMIHLPYLQPFDDVNKRVSRLAANIPLNNNNLAPLSFVDVPKELYIKALLGVYEFNDVSLMSDVFMYAYKRSANRYAAVIKEIGQPDRFRMQYRKEIAAVISEIIKEALGPEKAKRLIATAVTNIPPRDQERFLNYVENDLLSVHDGNFAKYQVTPSEFSKWKGVWTIDGKTL